MEALIVRSLAGDSSADDEKRLSEWIAQSRENQRQYLDFKKAFELSKAYYAGQAPRTGSINIEKEWEHLAGRIRHMELSSRGQTPGDTIRKLVQDRHPTPRPWLRLATPILLLVPSG